MSESLRGRPVYYIDNVHKIVTVGERVELSVMVIVHIFRNDCQLKTELYRTTDCQWSSSPGKLTPELPTQRG